MVVYEILKGMSNYLDQFVFEFCLEFFGKFRILKDTIPIHLVLEPFIERFEEFLSLGNPTPIHAIWKVFNGTIQITDFNEMGNFLVQDFHNDSL